MNILFLGDVAAVPGRNALTKHLPALKERFAVDCTIVNGENAANGRGITAETAKEIFSVGADVITLGDHTFDQRGVEELLAGNPRIIRPANYPQGSAGRGHTVFTTAAGKRVGVINLQGRVFMRHQVDCPFVKVREMLAQDYRLGDTVDALVIDMHAEATAEKCMMGYACDGKASLVVGTHTHIPTHDARIQPKGTAYLTDAGMCGDYDSSLGMSYESVMPGLLTVGRNKFQPAAGEGTLCGVVVSVGDNGLATSITQVKVGGVLGE
ncbi:MAG: YmdB family metallophosphoesterase [Pseudomonadaceae bacterium]|nr:YmdB family metallophosphoesterase [Pseudomonadaceae bacterium]